MMATMRRSSLLLVPVFVLAGCKVDVDLTVRSAEEGSGTVMVVFTLDRAAARTIGDLEATLGAAGLEEGGWSVSSRRTPDGTTLVAEKDFAHPEEVEGIVRELSGRSGPFQRFRLDLDAAVFTIASRFSGQLDMRRAAIDRFAPSDPALLAGLDLAGLDLETARRALGGASDEALSVAVNVDLPGNEGHNAPDAVRTVPRWEVRLGEVADISASSTQGRWARIAPFSVAILVALVALVRIWLRRSRRRASARG
jgi:hypothetical protein